VSASVEDAVGRWSERAALARPSAEAQHVDSSVEAEWTAVMC
jgi:hypothetical protein